MIYILLWYIHIHTCIIQYLSLILIFTLLYLVHVSQSEISLSAKVLFAIWKSNQSPSIKWIFLCRKLLSFIINHLCCQWLKKLKMSITYLICKTNDFCTFNEVILNGWFKVDDFPNMDQNTRLENNLL